MYHHFHHRLFCALSDFLLVFDELMYRYFMPLALPILGCLGVVCLWLKHRKPLFITAVVFATLYAAYTLPPPGLWLHLRFAA
jgi:hypothetical protein